MDDWLRFIPFNDITVNLIILAGGYLVFTRRLIWYKDYDAKAKEAEQWKELALRLLGTTERLTAQSEVTTDVISHTAGKDSGHDETVS
jgi:hypothetical protein